MNLNFQINNLLKKFESGDKLDSYRELLKIFKKNKDDNLLRYNLAVIQQKLNLNEEAKINYNYLIKFEKNIKAMINLYNIFFSEEKYYEALNIIDNILKVQQIENVQKDKAFACLKLNNVKIDYRGNIVKIAGKKNAVEETKLALQKLFEEANKGYEIDEDRIRDTKSFLTFDINNESQSDLFIKTKKRKIIARSLNQKKYFHLLNNKSIVFASGPAGTGKTYIAVAKAVSYLQKGTIKKIILSRPAVEAGESLGFLPGDLKEKVDPYLAPLYDSLRRMLPENKLTKLFEQKTIEVIPLAYMRGRTLDSAYMILDEAQNATLMQMKMFLTRLGIGSRAIVTGDITQIDLQRRTDSGLVQVSNILNNVEGIGFVTLDCNDVVRHSLVMKIIQAYDENSSIEKNIK